MRDLIDAMKAPPPRARRSRTPFVVLGAAVLAAGATVIAWQAFTKHEPTAVASTTPTTPIEPTTPAPLPTVVTPDAGAPVVVPDAKVEIVVEKPPPPPKAKPAVAAIKKAAPEQKESTGSAAATATNVQPSTPTTAQPPLRPLNNPKYSVSRAYAVMTAFCKIPIDVKKPDPSLGAGAIDVGTVMRKETVIATVADRESYLELYEVRGQRDRYRFQASAGALGTLDIPVGQEVALCIDPGRSEKSDIYQVPSSWSGGLDLVAAVVPLTGPPRLDQLKAFSPLHIEDGKLVVSGDKGTLQMKPAAHYLVHAKIGAADGARWDMKNWWLEVGKVKGAEFVAPGKFVWLVIEKPVFETGVEGEKPRLVAKAVLVIDELLPH